MFIDPTAFAAFSRILSEGLKSLRLPVVLRSMVTSNVDWFYSIVILVRDLLGAKRTLVDILQIGLSDTEYEFRNGFFWFL